MRLLRISRHPLCNGERAAKYRQDCPHFAPRRIRPHCGHAWTVQKTNGKKFVEVVRRRSSAKLGPGTINIQAGASSIFGSRVKAKRIIHLYCEKKKSLAPTKVFSINSSFGRIRKPLEYDDML